MAILNYLPFVGALGAHGFAPIGLRRGPAIACGFMYSGIWKQAEIHPWYILTCIP
jgi:hypothetical protein